MSLQLAVFSLCICGIVTVNGSTVSLMPLLKQLATPSNASVSSGTSNFRQRLSHHLDNSDNFTLRVRFVHTSCFKTITRFQLFPTLPDGSRRPIVGVEILPYKHQVVIRFQQRKRVKAERFYYDIPSGRTSELSVMFADEQLLLNVNCTRIYRRHVGAIDMASASGDYEALFRSKGANCATHSRLEAAYLLFNSEFVEALPQCLESSCGIPSGVDVKQVMQDLKDAQTDLRVLRDEVSYLNRTLQKWDGCECAKYCTDGNLRISNGTKWDQGQEDCQCVNGETVCSCRKVTCSASESLYHNPNDLCPSCGANCVGVYTNVNHGQAVDEDQNKCRCLNGQITDCVSQRNNTQSEPKPGCHCCEEHQCQDNQGYCICTCTGKKCKHCPSNMAVHPHTGQCNRFTTVMYPKLADYNIALSEYFRRSNSG